MTCTTWKGKSDGLADFQKHQGTSHELANWFPRHNSRVSLQKLLREGENRALLSWGELVHHIWIKSDGGQNMVGRCVQRPFDCAYMCNAGMQRQRLVQCRHMHVEYMVCVCVCVCKNALIRDAHRLQNTCKQVCLQYAYPSRQRRPSRQKECWWQSQCVPSATKITNQALDTFSGLTNLRKLDRYGIVKWMGKNAPSLAPWRLTWSRKWVSPCAQPFWPQSRSSATWRPQQAKWSWSARGLFLWSFRQYSEAFRLCTLYVCWSKDAPTGTDTYEVVTRWSFGRDDCAMKPELGLVTGKAHLIADVGASKVSSDRKPHGHKEPLALLWSHARHEFNRAGNLVINLCVVWVLCAVEQTILMIIIRGWILVCSAGMCMYTKYTQPRSFMPKASHVNKVLFDWKWAMMQASTHFLVQRTTPSMIILQNLVHSPKTPFLWCISGTCSPTHTEHQLFNAYK